MDSIKKEIKKNNNYFDNLISFAVVGVIVILILYGAFAYKDDYDYEDEFCKYQGFDTGFKDKIVLGIYENIKCYKIIDYQVIEKEFYIKIEELKGTIEWKKVGDINCIVS